MGVLSACSFCKVCIVTGRWPLARVGDEEGECEECRVVCDDLVTRD